MRMIGGLGSMPGKTVIATEYSEEYIVARAVLLDALEALDEQRKALILVGSQAIYLHTGNAGLAVAEYTTDSDIAIDPNSLMPETTLTKAMESAGFTLDNGHDGKSVGIWSTLREIKGVPARITVDLLVPEKVGGGGRRAARLVGHPKGSSLKVPGLEGCLFDHTTKEICALSSPDSRHFEIEVAGSAALLVAKLIKLQERIDAAAGGRRDRRSNKDALDVLRLLRTSDLQNMAETLTRLQREEIASDVATKAIKSLPQLFGGSRSPGAQMAADAIGTLEDPEAVKLSCVVLANELIGAITDQL